MSERGEPTGRSGDVGFGFLGAGGIARGALAPAVHAARGARLEAVASRSRERAAALEPAGRVYSDYSALLEDPRVDVVYIALNNDAHRPWTIAALEAGKHVLCEKPLGLDEAEVAAMTAAAAASGGLLVEAFWYRWHPRTRRLEELLAEVALGPVRSVAADFSFNGPGDGDPAVAYRLDPARGGGALYDVGCYSLSAAHLALGPCLDVEDVDVTIGPTGVDLATNARLRTPDGASADVRCGIAVPDRQEVRVVGDAATLEFSPPAFMSRNAPSSLTIKAPDGSVREEHFAPVDPYTLMVEAVAGRLRGEPTFLVGLDHSAQIAASTAAIRRASA